MRGLQPIEDVFGGIFMSVVIACLAILPVLIQGCQDTKETELAKASSSALNDSLKSSNWSHLMCASFYLTENGGPAFPDPKPESLAELRSHAKALERWLGQQSSATRTRLISGFPEYVGNSSPHYGPMDDSQNADK